MPLSLREILSALDELQYTAVKVPGAHPNRSEAHAFRDGGIPTVILRAWVVSQDTSIDVASLDLNRWCKGGWIAIEVAQGRKFRSPLQLLRPDGKVVMFCIQEPEAAGMHGKFTAGKQAHVATVGSERFCSIIEAGFCEVATITPAGLQELQSMRASDERKKRSKRRPGRPRKTKPDSIDRVVKKIIARGQHESRKWGDLTRQYSDELPKGYTAGALRKRVDRSCNTPDAK